MHKPPLHFFPEDDPLLTSAEVAKRLGVVPERVRQLRRAGTLVPVYRTQGGGICLFATSDVEELAEERQQKQLTAAGKDHVSSRRAVELGVKSAAEAIGLDRRAPKRGPARENR